jgi:hypothetical protein
MSPQCVANLLVNGAFVRRYSASYLSLFDSYFFLPSFLSPSLFSLVSFSPRFLLSVLFPIHFVHYSRCRAIAQAASRRLPTAAARVRSQVRSCGICGGRRDTGAGFLRVLWFPLLILIPPTVPHPLLVLFSTL